ncbi:MAG: hypothetical protein MZU95_08530 [Desulfomicrobium escambiense]|nr:hypothetical protein [Desulfomicrobium escambiense]
MVALAGVSRPVDGIRGEDRGGGVPPGNPGNHDHQGAGPGGYPGPQAACPPVHQAVHRRGTQERGSPEIPGIPRPGDLHDRHPGGRCRPGDQRLPGRARQGPRIPRAIPSVETKDALVRVALSDREPMVISAAIRSLGRIGINDNDEVTQTISFIVNKLRHPPTGQQPGIRDPRGDRDGLADAGTGIKDPRDHTDRAPHRGRQPHSAGEAEGPPGAGQAAQVRGRFLGREIG